MIKIINERVRINVDRIVWYDVEPEKNGTTFTIKIILDGGGGLHTINLAGQSLPSVTAFDRIVGAQ